METTFKNGKQLLETLLATPNKKINYPTISKEDMRTISNDLRKDGYNIYAFENTGCAFEECDECDYTDPTYISLDTETNCVTIAYI